MIINAIVLDGDILYSSGWDGKVSQWDLTTKRQIGQTPLGHYVNSLALNGSKSETDVDVYAAGKGGGIVGIKF